MPDFRALTVDEVLDRILAAERPIFLLHNRPDGDTVGSGAPSLLTSALVARTTGY